MSKPKLVYFTSLSLLEFARCFPHAILALFLLGKGISVGQIALLQIPFMIAIIIFEIPSGMLSDTFRRKKVYILSILLLLVAYASMYYFDSFALFQLSWFVYGIASAMLTGTIEADFLEQYKSNPVKRKKFISHYQIVLHTSGILGGLFGAFLYPQIHSNIYLLSLLFMILSLISILPYKGIQVSKKETTEKVMRNHLHTIHAFCKKNGRVVIIPIIALGISQFFYQPFFQYWQVFYKNLHIEESTFGIMYAIFRIAPIVSAFVFSKLKVGASNNAILCSTLLLSIICFIVPISSIAVFPLLIALVNVYGLTLQYILTEKIDNGIMSSFISITSSTTRIMSVLVLVLCYLLLSHVDVGTTLFVHMLIFGCGGLIFSNIIKKMNNANLKDTSV